MSTPAFSASTNPWTGFYVGGDIGARGTQSTWTTTSAPFGFFDPSIATQTFHHSSTRFGGFTGYNWQFSPRWVMGIEADVGWANGKAVQPGYLPGIAGVGFNPFISAGDHVTVGSTWDASLRARYGYLVTPSTFVFATGGVALQRFTWRSECGVLTCGGFSDSDAHTVVGWTIGTGIETAVAAHWFLRGEYRYANFGTIHDGMNLGGFPAGFDIKLATNTFKLGLAYKFGDSVVTPGTAWPGSAHASDWRGFYLGAGIGPLLTRSAWTGVSFALPPIFPDVATQSYNDIAFNGSVFAGYNWQFARWILGIEADAGYAPNTATQYGAAPGFDGPLIAIVGEDYSSVRTSWNAGLRGRIGYVLTPDVLAYGTAGLAIQRYTFTSFFDCLCAVPSIGLAKESRTFAGVSIGAGIETRLFGQWRARAEYRYADFGTQRVTLRHPVFAPVPFVSDFRLSTQTAQFALIRDLN